MGALCAFRAQSIVDIWTMRALRRGFTLQEKWHRGEVPISRCHAVVHRLIEPIGAGCPTLTSLDEAHWCLLGRDDLSADLGSDTSLEKSSWHAHVANNRHVDPMFMMFMLFMLWASNS